MNVNGSEYVPGVGRLGQLATQLLVELSANPYPLQFLTHVFEEVSA